MIAWRRKGGRKTFGKHNVNMGNQKEPLAVRYSLSHPNVVRVRGRRLLGTQYADSMQLVSSLKSNPTRDPCGDVPIPVSPPGLCVPYLQQPVSGFVSSDGETTISPIARIDSGHITRSPRVACTLLTSSVANSSSDLLPMSPLTPSQQLRRLDKFSPQFPDQITDLLREQGYRNHITNLQDEDLLWLVEYLNDVRLRLLSPTHH